MKKLFFILLGLFSLLSAKAQNATELPQTGIKASLDRNFKSTGFAIGIEKPYKVTQVEKQKKWGVKTILKERYWAFNVGFYHQNTFHDNLYLLAEWQMRRQKSKGWFFEFAPGVGYSRTFLDGTTYQVVDNGEVTHKSISGYNYALLSLTGGVGYDFSKKMDTPIKVFLKPNLSFFAPYNSSLYMRPSMSLGIVYSAKNFLKTPPSVKIKKK